MVPKNLHNLEVSNLEQENRLAVKRGAIITTFTDPSIQTA